MYCSSFIVALRSSDETIVRVRVCLLILQTFALIKCGTFFVIAPLIPRLHSYFEA